ncbi:uncharacterized protein VTP21DRAFT_2998 [Calcarisporiella thermophila]|uniref:uncharacterized protein n=1 Tax=Calcarisporiella thermophila TaxID=911321 RepID=UPI0037421640
MSLPDWSSSLSIRLRRIHRIEKLLQANLCLRTGQLLLAVVGVVSASTHLASQATSAPLTYKPPSFGAELGVAVGVCSALAAGALIGARAWHSRWGLSGLLARTLICSKAELVASVLLAFLWILIIIMVLTWAPPVGAAMLALLCAAFGSALLWVGAILVVAQLLADDAREYYLRGKVLPFEPVKGLNIIQPDQPSSNPSPPPAVKLTTSTGEKAEEGRREGTVRKSFPDTTRLIKERVSLPLPPHQIAPSIEVAQCFFPSPPPDSSPQRFSASFRNGPISPPRKPPHPPPLLNHRSESFRLQQPPPLRKTPSYLPRISRLSQIRFSFDGFSMTNRFSTNSSVSSNS